MNITSKSVGRFLTNNAVIILMAAVSVVVGILEPKFFSLNNFRNLMSNTAIRFIVAMGVSGCLITKGTDLSAGRSVGFSACIAATFLQRADYTSKVYPDMGEPFILFVLLGVIAVAMLFGLINGLVISYLNVPPFIATLGTQTIIYGIAQLFTDSQPIGGLREDYTGISSGSVRFFIPALNKLIPYVAIFAAIIGLIMWMIYNKTRHGKYMYAIGGNEKAAEVSGINVKKSKIIIYITAGLMYGIAGFLLGGKAGGASVGLGPGYELEAIAGCTIGGVSTNGGVGRISGILVGVLVFELLKIAMLFLRVRPDYTYIVQGVVIITAVALDMRKYITKK